MSASQAEGRGFKSRFPLQESQGVTSYDVTPFLMRRCRCATNGPFPNLDQPPGEIPKPEHLHGVRPRPSLVQRALQGETGNPFPVYGGGSIRGNAGQKGQHHHRLRRKTDLCITFPHTVFFAAPRPVRGAPRSPSMYWKSWLLCIKRNETVFTPFLIFLPTGTS